jgi:hypothetical protein
MLEEKKAHEGERRRGHARQRLDLGKRFGPLQYFIGDDMAGHAANSTRRCAGGKQSFPPTPHYEEESY